MFILAAALIVAGVALFVAAPLDVGLLGTRAKSPSELQAERNAHERALAVQGLSELEFDREMGKLSGADYESMHKTLEDRALTAMALAENLRVTAAEAVSATKPSVAQTTQLMPRPASTILVSIHQPRPLHMVPQQIPSRRFRFCAQCGTRAIADSTFCPQCGIATYPLGGAASWTQ